MADLYLVNWFLKLYYLPKTEGRFSEQVINNAVKTTTEDVDLTHNTSKKTLAYKKTLSKFVNFESPIQIKNYLYTVVFTTARVKGQDPSFVFINF